MSQVPQMLPTPFTTPSAYDQTAPQSNDRPIVEPLVVWCVCIPGDGSPIHRKMIEIVTGENDPTYYMPALQNWWPKGDPTAKAVVRVQGIQRCSTTCWILKYVLGVSAQKTYFAIESPTSRKQS